MRILLFGGTTEGKAVSNWLSDLRIDHYYSTKTTSGNYESKFGTRICGAMDRSTIADFCSNHEIDLLIDAAHPFADVLHVNIVAAAEELSVPVIRVERDAVPRIESEYVCYHQNLAEVLQVIHSKNHTRVLSLMGVKAVPEIHAKMPDTEFWYRILDFPTSLQLAKNAGVPDDRIIRSQSFEGLENLEEFLIEKGIEAMITKESGYTGFLDQKMELAQKYRVPLYVICKPELPKYQEIIHNREVLQKYLKDQFGWERCELAQGFTSGVCASLSAKAALKLLLGEKNLEKEQITLADGGICEMSLHKAVSGQDFAICSVVKNSGDDPDVTDGMEIGVRMSWNTSGKIRFVKGEGVGTVTLPGLGIPVGEPAVNPVPRKMIEKELTALLRENQIDKGLDVSVFVPMGRKLAAKTFNPKLGIEGGISIIGTTGRIKPYSLDAFVQSIRKQVDLAIENGHRHIVMNSGGRSERYLKARFSELEDLAFLQYGNLIGEMLQILNQSGAAKVSMGIMTGKAVKLAAGNLDTHSRKVLLDHAFLQQMAREANYSEELIEKVGQIKMARELESLFSFSEEEPFFQLLKSKCVVHCKKRIANCEFELILISNDGKMIG